MLNTEVYQKSLTNSIKKYLLLCGILRPELYDIDHIFLHVTNRCNYNCSYCYNKKIKVMDMLFPAIKKILKDIKDRGITNICLLGGEIFLHPDYDEIIEICLSQNFNVRIFTNGSLIDTTNIHNLKRFQNLELVIKFDERSTYLETTCSKSYYEVIKNIKELVDNDIETSTFITVTKGNLIHLSKIISLSLNLGAMPRMERYVSSTNDSHFNMTALDWGKAQDIYVKSISEHLGLDYLTMLNIFKNLAQSTPTYCTCSIRSFSVNIDGSTSLCPFNNRTFGNIIVDGLSKTIKKYNTYRKKLNAIPDDCQTCESKTFCRGGCKTYNMLHEANKNNKDLLCFDKRLHFLNFCQYEFSSLIKKVVNLSEKK